MLILKENILDLKGILIRDLKFHNTLDSSIYKKRDIKSSSLNGNILTVFENKITVKFWNLKGQLLGDYETENDHILHAHFTPEENNILEITKNNSVVI